MKRTEFPKKVREYIKKRDNNQCVICGAYYGLQIMHIFKNRSHGGLGTRENGCLGCMNCHRIMDNPLGKRENELSKIYLKYCKDYLRKVENIDE